MKSYFKTLLSVAAISGLFCANVSCVSTANQGGTVDSGQIEGVEKDPLVSAKDVVGFVKVVGGAAAYAAISGQSSKDVRASAILAAYGALFPERVLPATPQAERELAKAGVIAEVNAATNAAVLTKAQGQSQTNIEKAAVKAAEEEAKADKPITIPTASMSRQSIYQRVCSIGGEGTHEPGISRKSTVRSVPLGEKMAEVFSLGFYLHSFAC